MDNLKKVKDYTRQLLPDWDGEELHPEMSAGAWFCVSWYRRPGMGVGWRACPADV